MTAAVIAVTRLECGSFDALVAVDGRITAVTVDRSHVFRCECGHLCAAPAEPRRMCPHIRTLHDHVVSLARAQGSKP